MQDFITNSIFFGVFLSLFAYEIGMFLKKKTGLVICNPLLVSIIIVIVFLLAFKIPYAEYSKGSQYISYLLTPATVCLALPLYEQISLLKDNFLAICLGIASGVLTSLSVVLALSLIFKFGHAEYAKMLPKSITTAIGIDISKELGGYPEITVAVIIITGVFGNVFADYILKLFLVKHPIAKGIGIGTAAHAMGTSKAIELGEIEGAMSSLSIAVAGLFTVIGAGIFANFI